MTRPGTSWKPPAAYREDPVLFTLALAAAGTSTVPLLLHLAGVIRMPYTLSFVTLPALVFLLCAQALAGRAGRVVIVNRLRAGFVAGLVALVAYNLTRWLVSAVAELPSSPFYSIRIFGSLITGRAPDTLAAELSGWAYHVSNGVTFAIMYALVAGPARWWCGLLWGLALETAMLLVYPSSAILRPPALASFVVVSLVSHAAYGAAVGLCTRRLARPRGGGDRG